jgi:periplasmic protein TonB
LETLTKPDSASLEAANGQNSRSNPVCLELTVAVRSLPGEKGDSSSAKPVREEGRTVIVFDGGAVLRLPSSIPPGQSVIVSNPQGRDVVCRVVNPRGLPNIKGYIEVEFAEAVNDFWGIHQTAVQPPVVAIPPPVAPPAKVEEAKPAVQLAPKSAVNTLPESKVPTGNAPSFEDIAGLVRMSPAPTAPVKLPEPPTRPSAPKITKEPIPVPVEAAKPLSVPKTAPVAKTPQPVPAAKTLQQVEEQSQISGLWENAPVLSQRAQSSGDVLSKGIFTSSTLDSAAASDRSQTKMLLILGGAAVFLIGLGTGWFFLHRGSAPAPSASVAAVSSQPAAPAHVAESDAIQPTSNAPTVVTDNPTPAPPPPAAAPVGAPVAAVNLPVAAAPVAKDNPVGPSKAEAKQPVVRSAPPSQPALGLKMSAPTAESRNVGRLVDGSVPNIGEVSGSSALIASTSGAALPTITRTDVPPAPPTGSLAASSPARAITEPKLISTTQLTYPPAAKSAKVEGDVLVTANIDATGKVIGAKAVSGPALLRVGAEDTVRGWKYQPATIGGKPVPTQVTVKIQFHLK